MSRTLLYMLTICWMFTLSTSSYFCIHPVKSSFANIIYKWHWKLFSWRLGFDDLHVLIGFTVRDLVAAVRADSKSINGLLTRYAKLRVTHAPGTPGTFFPPLRVCNPGMHHGMCVTHVPWCMPELLTSGFLWSRWRGIRFKHSWRMGNLQFCVSGKRPINNIRFGSAGN